MRRFPNSDCYLCGSESVAVHAESVRDSNDLRVLECENCGLRFLSSFEHVAAGFYESSGMHGDEPLDVEKWIRQTEMDDQRRFEFLSPMLKQGMVFLDYGCGNGNLLLKLRDSQCESYGVEIERRLREHFISNGLTVSDSLDKALSVLKGKVDILGVFHVLEHLPDPIGALTTLKPLLKEGGRMFVEVPNADDALISFYQCEAFIKYTYWSCHLFMFNSATLRRVMEKAGLAIKSIRQIQRYPLSNHLYWLAKGKPGGHVVWDIDTPQLSEAYTCALAAKGKCDTILAEVFL